MAACATVLRTSTFCRDASSRRADSSWRMATWAATRACVSSMPTTPMYSARMAWAMASSGIMAWASRESQGSSDHRPCEREESRLSATRPIARRLGRLVFHSLLHLRQLAALNAAEFPGAVLENHPVRPIAVYDPPLQVDPREERALLVVPGRAGVNRPVERPAVVDRPGVPRRDHSGARHFFPCHDPEVARSPDGHRRSSLLGPFPVLTRPTGVRSTRWPRWAKSIPDRRSPRL